MHYYTHAGEPAHFEGNDGGPTTLREARKLDLLPSVTTVLGIKDKPQLTAWKMREAVKMAAELIPNGHTPPEDLQDRDGWANFIITKSRKATFAKADAGTVIHDALERYGLGDTSELSPEHLALGGQVAELIREKTGLPFERFTPEQQFAHASLGYGGKCDLYTDSPGEEWVIDYKTKDTVSANERGYPEQAEQLAAYGKGLGLKAPRYANLFIARTPNADGTWSLAWYEHRDNTAWHRFHASLYLWQVCKKFGPLYEAVVDEETHRDNGE